MDAFLLHALLAELARLTGGRVRAVDQTDPATLQITVRGADTSTVLALSCDPTFPRLEPLGSPEPAAEAGPFLTILRDHLAGASLVEMRQLGFDRTVVFGFSKKRAFSPPEQLTLLFQLFGKRANLYLESTRGTLASLKPGVIPRVPGPQGPTASGVPRLDPLAAPADQLKGLLRPDAHVPLERVLVDRFTGISPLWAREILFRADLAPETFLGELKPWQVDLLWSHLVAWVETIRAGRVEPRVYYETAAGRPFAVTPLPLEHLRETPSRGFASVTETVSAFYRALVPAAAEAALRERIERQHHRDLRRVSRSLKRVAERRRQASREAEFRRFGELILSNLQDLSSGKDELTVIDHFDPGRLHIRIPADPAKSPRLNAQAYFDKARKAKRAKLALAEESARLNRRREQLETWIAEIPGLTGESLRARARRLGIVRRESDVRRRADERPTPFRTFHTRDGRTVWVGRNDRENDLLTHSRAAPHDLWFHARGLAGSHVVLRCPDRRQRPSKRAILEAARIAAYYSKGRKSKTVDVTYTEKRYVRKPKRGKPGLALVTNEQVLFVEPGLPEEDAG